MNSFPSLTTVFVVMPDEYKKNVDLHSKINGSKSKSTKFVWRNIKIALKIIVSYISTLYLWLEKKKGERYYYQVKAREYLI